ncbi:MAG: hypothetical protein AAF431_12340 [Pseudomonadota bacterium]
MNEVQKQILYTTVCCALSFQEKISINKIKGLGRKWKLIMSADKIDNAPAPFHPNGKDGKQEK